MNSQDMQSQLRNFKSHSYVSLASYTDNWALWMTFNKRPGGYFEPILGGSKTKFNEGRGGAYFGSFDCVQGDASPPFM